MTDPLCTECGEQTSLQEDQEQLDNGWDPFGTRKTCLAHTVCHHCAYWLINIEKHQAHPERFIVAGGAMFHLRPPDEGRLVDRSTFVGFLGFGGAEWAVLLNGERILTNNLWNNGTIPDRFRERLPDNCRLFSRFKDWDGVHKEVQFEGHP